MGIVQEIRKGKKKKERENENILIILLSKDFVYH